VIKILISIKRDLSHYLINFFISGNTEANVTGRTIQYFLLQASEQARSLFIRELTGAERTLKSHSKNRRLSCNTN